MRSRCTVSRASAGVMAGTFISDSFTISLCWSRGSVAGLPSLASVLAELLKQIPELALHPGDDRRVGVRALHNRRMDTHQATVHFVEHLSFSCDGSGIG